MLDKLQKFFIPFLGVVLLGQILLISTTLIRNTIVLDREIDKLQQEKTQLSMEEQEWQRHLKGQRKDAARLSNSMPSDFLGEFGDHEELLAGFLDFLPTTYPPGLSVTLATPTPLSWSGSPAPHHRTELTMSFSPESLEQAGDFLAALTSQQRFPIKVRSFGLRRSGDLMQGSLEAVLVIPAASKTAQLAAKNNQEAGS